MIPNLRFIRGAGNAQVVNGMAENKINIYICSTE